MRAGGQLMVAMLALMGLAACSEKAAPLPPPVRPVISMIVEPEAQTIAGFVGTVEPQVTTELAFRVGGSLLSRTVDVGDLVSKDQVIASVESRQLEFAVRSAEANLSTAQSQLANAAASETRQQSLLQTDNASQAVLEAAQQQRQSAQASVVQAQSALTKAQEQLGYANITASFDGVVIAVDAEVGQIVAPGQAVVTIAKPDARDAVVDIPEWLSGDVQVGTQFDVALQLDPSIAVVGAVREVAPQADPTTRTRRLRIALDKPPATFWLGTTVSATPRIAAGANMSVPQSALLQDGGTSKVWIVDTTSNTVATREVQVDAARDGLVPVTSGLAAGDRVVTAGVHKLAEGQQVRIQESASP